MSTIKRMVDYMSQINKKISKKDRSIIDHGMIIGKRRIYPFGEKQLGSIKLDELLLDLLTKHGPLTRSELVKLTNIPRTTLYDNLSKLISKGLVIKESLPRATRGRPKVVFKIKE